MPDIAPLLVALLSAAAVPLLVFGLLGRRDRSQPRCRRCGADVRGRAWDEGPICACGAHLDVPNSVRLPRRRRWRIVVLGALSGVLALGLGRWETQVQAHMRAWCDELPTWLFARVMARGLDDRIGWSLYRRVHAHPDVADARLLLTSFLDALEADPVNVDRYAPAYLRELGALADPQGELGERFVQRCLDLTEFVISENAGEAKLDIVPKAMAPSGWQLVVRVDAVVVNGVECPFQMIDGKGTPLDRRWAALADRSLDFRVAGASAALAGNTTIRGRAAFCPAASHCLSRDQTIATNDDPRAWGLPVALASFERTATSTPAAVPGGWIGGPVPPPSQWEIFLPSERIGRARPQSFAAMQVAACGVTGAIVGVALALMLGLAALGGRVRPRLVLPTCAHCDSTLVGVGGALPERCSECGRAVSREAPVNWTPRLGRALPSIILMALAFVIVLAVARWTAVPLALAINGRLVKQATSQRFGEWLGARALGQLDKEDADDARRDLAWRPFRIPSTVVPGIAPDFVVEDAMTAAIARVARDWRSMPECDPVQPYWMRSRVLSQLARAVALERRDNPAADGALLDVVKEMAERADLPRLLLPRCVREGDQVRVFDNHYDSGVSGFVRLAATPGQPPNDWQLANGSTLMLAGAPGDVELDLEWAIIFPEMSEQRKSIASDEVDRRLQVLPLRGVMHRRVRVLPASVEEIAVDDPALSPLQAPTAIELKIQEIGERDEIALNVFAFGAGVALRGEWILELPDGDVTLTHAPGASLWVALAPTPVPLPERLVARFVPLKSDPNWDTSSKPPAIVWNVPSELRLERRQWDVPRERKGRVGNYVPTS